MDKWQIKHRELMKTFLLFLNKQTDVYVLKGGTSLMLCYELNRFSEDIDLDGTRNESGLKKGIFEYISEFCKNNNYEYRIAKDTPYVKRCFIHYGGEKPLKIEASFRDINEFDPNSVSRVDGIIVYVIDKIAQLKCDAYKNRDRTRDMFDLCFIVTRYMSSLSAETITNIRNVLYYKGIEQYDYLISQADDPLIDKDLLLEMFLETLDKMELLDDDKLIDTSKNQKDIDDIYEKTVFGNIYDSYGDDER